MHGMARRGRRAKPADPLAQATIEAAEKNRQGVVEAARLSRNGAVVAAKMQAMAVLIGAVIAGTCGVAGVSVQGYWAAEVEKVKAAEPSDPRAGPDLAGTGTENEYSNPLRAFASLEDFCHEEPDDCVTTTTRSVDG